MKPADYFREIVEPTIGEFMAEPKDVRRAYLACVVAFHFADAAAVHAKRKPHQVEDELKGLAPDFQIVGDVANLAKHLELNPQYRRNQGRPLPKVADVHIGPQAAFDDGTSWDDAEDVVRIRDGHGRLVDLRDCVRMSCDAIKKYLTRSDMQ